MELWIRSQDKKKLHKINKLELDNDETGIFDLETYVLLGKYKTKERALEILDEIQENLRLSFVYYEEFKGTLPKPCVIYEMPKE